MNNTTPTHQMNRQIVLLTAALMFFLAAPPAEAEERSAQPQSFAKFWAGFKGAVARGDREAVVAATHLPSMRLSKAAFLQTYLSTFTRQVQKCFAAAKPVRTEDRDSYSVFCGEEYYYFEKVNGTYKLTDIGMND